MRTTTSSDLLTQTPPRSAHSSWGRRPNQTAHALGLRVPVFHHHRTHCMAVIDFLWSKAGHPMATCRLLSRRETDVTQSPWRMRQHLRCTRLPPYRQQLGLVHLYPEGHPLPGSRGRPPLGQRGPGGDPQAALELTLVSRAGFTGASSMEGAFPPPPLFASKWRTTRCRNEPAPKGRSFAPTWSTSGSRSSAPGRGTRAATCWRGTRPEGRRSPQ